jgi:cytochrome c peroxidase
MKLSSKSLFIGLAWVTLAGCGETELGLRSKKGEKEKDGHGFAASASGGEAGAQSGATASAAQAVSFPESFEYRHRIALNARPRAMTWDGRVAFECDRKDASVKRCYATAFRPALVKGADTPNFSNAWSARLPLVDLGGSAIASATEVKVHMTASMDPLLDYPQGNPYRCGSGGGAQPLGEYECYKIMLVAYSADQNLIFAGTLKALAGQVVVHAYATDADGSMRRRSHPEVSEFKSQTGWIQMATAGAPFQDTFEPATTADGRLLFTNNGRYFVNNVRGSFGAFARGWSGRRLVHQLVSESQAFKDKYPVARQRWRDALGRACDSADDVCGGFYPWVSPDGAELFFTKGEVFEDGTELESRNLFVVGPRTGYREVHVDARPNQDRMEFVGTPQAFGGATGTMWHDFPEVDSLVAFPFTKGRPVYPLMGKGTYGELDLLPFTSDYAVYLPMNELMTGRGQAFSGGGEFQRISGRYVPVRTGRPVSHKLVPDVSGHFHTGLLNAGAHFPQEYFLSVPGALAEYPSEEVGSVGKGVFLQPGGAVFVKSARDANVNPFADAPGSLLVNRPNFTVEVDYQVLWDTGGAMALVTREGHWQIVRAADGSLGCHFQMQDGSVKTVMTSARLPVSKRSWYRLGMIVAGERLSFFVNGALVYHREEPWLASRITAGAGDIFLGPRSGATSGPAVFIVDEFALTAFPRTHAFVRERATFGEQAFHLTSAELAAKGIPFPAELTPPRGFKRSDVRVPAALEDVLVRREFGALARLGDELFHDVALTGKGMSCNTCHDSARRFIDVRVNGEGDRVRLSPGALPGTKTARHSPVAFNRAFSTVQFADGRATSLSSQVVMPIVNPDEMAGDKETVLAYLRASRHQAKFKDVFGTGATWDRLGLAFTAYLMTQMEGDSTYDRLQEGDRAGVSGEDLARFTRGKALFTGKAHCSSCHNGPNFSDERFHNTGSTADSSGRILDGGRRRVSRVTKDGGAVKTPTLRAVGATAPYFTTGRFGSLLDVVKFYERGGVDAGVRDPEMIPFTLTPAERSDLIFFLKTL